jgi:hypothetical protein
LNVIRGYVKLKLTGGVEADSIGINNIESWRAHYWFIGQQIAAAARANDGWRQAESLAPPGSPI